MTNGRDHEEAGAKLPSPLPPSAIILTEYTLPPTHKDEARYILFTKKKKISFFIRPTYMFYAGVGNAAQGRQEFGFK